MNIHNDQSDTTLTAGLQATLDGLRQERAFSASRYIAEKAELLNGYMRHCNLKACVVAVSGGIDSAVVLGLVANAAKQEGSPIERIVPVLLPVFDRDAATNQDVALIRGREVCAAFDLDHESLALNLSWAYAELQKLVDEGMGVKGEGWASGQLVAYTRTPALYYITSLLSQQGTPGILVGTTNRDEGAYIGFFGKASDGLVDVQLISDLHKSEVFAVGAELKAPPSVLEAVPTGDMYDGRVDEVVFGAPYDFVELFLQFKGFSREHAKAIWDGWAEADQERYAMLSERLEAMHRYNAHKYFGKSPAVHLNAVNDPKVRGAWDYKVFDLDWVRR